VEDGRTGSRRWFVTVLVGAPEQPEAVEVDVDSFCTYRSVPPNTSIT